MSSSEVGLLRFEKQPVRIIMRNGEPRWVVVDVCKVLGIKQPSVALRSLDDDEKEQVSIAEVSSNHVSQQRKVWTVNESGLYLLIFKSRKQAAKRFTRWVTHEVLPEIRRTGSYGAAAAADTWLQRDAREVLEWLERHGLDHATYRSLGPEREALAWYFTMLGNMVLALRDGDRKLVSDIRKFEFRIHGRIYKDLDGRTHRYSCKESAEVGTRFSLASMTGDAEGAGRILATHQPGLRVIDGGRTAGEVEGAS